MAFEGLRSKLRSLGSSGSEAASEAPAQVRDAGRRATGAVARRAPATGLEGNRKPREPSAREKIAKRLQSSGQMRKPIGDANLEPGADPREIEAFARGDTHTGEWFGESEPTQDPFSTPAAQGDDADGFEWGPFVEELLDERGHEGGHYAYEDERETGPLDDGMDVGVRGVEMRW
jgi:hypothetical protein